MVESDEATATIPSLSHGVLTEILRDGAQRLLAWAIHAEVGEWIDRYIKVVGYAGRREVGSDGYHSGYTVLTGVYSSARMRRYSVGTSRLSGYNAV